MKKIIAILCMAVIALNSAAQSPLSFHAKAGIGTSRFHGKDANSETKIACKAGIGAEYALNKTWVVQSALEFVSIGGKDEIGHIHGARMNELYLQLPVTLAARLHLGKNYHASLAAGPYAAIGVGGTTSGEVYNPISSSPASPFRVETFGKMIDGKMGNNRFDAGIAVSIALEYRRFVFGAEMQMGLITVNKQLNRITGMPEEEKYLPKNFASFFTLGYRFR
ncbi:outer membrane beta-barrel protein [Bacteroides heparinolyticus]|uniref:outer membrane beta-barrel protein n=1 Tax=Prevotella heparinolytica TaxID=28113 RepID=UPI0035A02883